MKSLISSLTRILAVCVSMPLIAISLLAVFPQTAVLAATNTAPSNNTDYDPCTVFNNCVGGTEKLSDDSGSSIVFSVVQGINLFLIYIGAPIAVLFIVLGGYKMVTASGNDSEYKAGRSMVINAVIGLVLIIISVTIVRLITVIIPGLNVFGS